MTIKSPRRRRRSKAESESTLTRFVSSLPCAGISKLVLTGLCIILTVVTTNLQPSAPSPSCLALLTIYGVFALSGIVDILAFYTATASLLPKQVRLIETMQEKITVLALAVN